MYQNAGEKGDKHHDPSDPPRRRANKRPGLGTMENDRPPV
jgi:transposase